VSATLPRQVWRPIARRASIVAGSLFVAWHSAVVVLAAMPPSYLSSQIYPFFRPYAEFLHLDGGWAFFAPDPTAGRLLRYSVEDAGGKRMPFAFTEAFSRADPAYFRFSTLSTAVDADTPALMTSMAQMLCRKHAAQQPVRIVFTLAQQRRITPEQHEAGLRPLDASLLQLTELAPVACQP